MQGEWLVTFAVLECSSQKRELRRDVSGLGVVAISHDSSRFMFFGMCLVALMEECAIVVC